MEKEMNFDKVVDRENSYCQKYDNCVIKFGTDDVMPLWVADMDLPVSSSIVDAIKHRADHFIFGYTNFYDEYYNSIQRWMKYSHGWEVEKEWISPISSILAGLNFAVEVLTKKGDGVIIQPPIYPPFFQAVKKHGRKLLENELKLVDGNYEIDFEDFEQKAKEAKLFLFCSPHNPTGRVWKRDELEKIAKICKKENVLIISDEVHADLVYKEKHIPIGSLEDAKDITITILATSKSFNVASIVNAYAIIENSSLKRRFIEVFTRYSITHPNPLSIVTTIAAYQKSDKWLKELKIYLQDNLAYIKMRLENMPKIKAMPTESTFLLWLDCSGLGLSDKELERFFIVDAKLGLNTGVSFGRGGEGFMRLNFAVSRSILVIAMDRLERAYTMNKI